MIIYEAEACVDKLADKILANQSIAYYSELTPWTPTEREGVQKDHLSHCLKDEAKVRGLSLGSAFDGDLFFTKSILVSTNWNRNDDVFCPTEVWSSRHTPSHKPTNIEHDENRLVGHITETWALDSGGNVIPDDTAVADLPDFYHIANGAVVYTNWQDDKLVERTNQLIASIESGKMFVSMEAIFTNFSYAVITPEKSYHVVARNDETSFLTKHLRCYGGDGKFEGCKVGRLLKNITFSGKGYVEQPANPHSVIFEDDNVFNHTAASTKNPFSKESGVSFPCSSTSSNKETEIPSMSDTQSDFLKSQNDDLKASVTSLQAKVDELTKANSEVGVKELETKIESLSNKLEATEKERDEAVANIETLNSDKTELGDQLKAISEVKEALEKEVTEAKENQVKTSRVSQLVEGGVNKELAETKVELFAGLNDEQFENIAVDIIAAFPKKDEDEDKEGKDKKSKCSDATSEDDISEDQAEAEASENVLADAEADEQPNLTVEASDDGEDNMEAVRSELQKVLASRLGYDVEDDETDSNE